MFIFVFLCLNWQVSQFEEFDLGEWPLHPPYHLIITITRIIIIMRKTMSMTMGMTGDVSERSPPQGGRCHPLLGSSFLPHYALKRQQRSNLNHFTFSTHHVHCSRSQRPVEKLIIHNKTWKARHYGAEDTGIVK